MEYKYKFSVIIPIYNVENYLEETIESVINQTIGFEENIQMILVNDGSPDNSEEICLKYKELYTNNVIYVKQENAGVSAARNNGMKYIEGKYVNFLDSDDIWDLDVFEKAYEMFEAHDSIDVVSFRMKEFEAKNKYHILDYKYYKNRIVDIFEEYCCIQLSASSVVIRATALTNIKFDEKLKHMEDAKLINEIILQKEHYGIISTSNYYVRKHELNDSATQQQKYDKLYYLNTPDRCFKYLFDLSKKKYGKVIPYIQYLIMYDLQYRFIKNEVNTLTPKEEKKYVETIIEILKEIDDRIIWYQKSLWRERKIYCLSLKYGYDIRKQFEYDKGAIYFNNIKVNDINNNHFLQIALISIKDNNLYIEGKISDYYPKSDYRIYIKTNTKDEYELKYYDMPFNDQIAFDGNCFFKGIGFKVQFPIDNIDSFRIMIDYQDVHTKRLHFSCGALSGLNKDLKNYYLVKGKYILTTKDNVISIKKNKKGLIREKEKKYIETLKKKGKKNIIRIRYLYRLLRKFKKRQIWLISDRPTVANDNGMHLFKYINSIKTDIDSYFVISKKSPDYKKMKKYGKVLDIDSLKYKLYFLLADKIISSQASDWVLSAFGNDTVYLSDLYRYKFVFLQHGITKDDASKWLHKQTKNISMLVTAAKGEYDSMIYGNYAYTDKEIKLTGFPRFDNLNNNPKKQIAIMPTWRNSLSGPVNKISGEREYSTAFKVSEYFKFYNDLINDERLINKMNEKGYTGIFVVHPSHMENYIDFDGNDTFKIVEGFADYQKIFGESNLLLTDFSSVAFDFAYLNKPVIYTHFDEDTFFAGQVYDKGYFEYERDGFGPVIYDYETTVDELIKYIDNDCKLGKEYAKRIDKFYAYHDKNNCKRVYEEIKKI